MFKKILLVLIVVVLAHAGYQVFRSWEMSGAFNDDLDTLMISVRGQTEDSFRQLVVTQRLRQQTSQLAVTQPLRLRGRRRHAVKQPLQLRRRRPTQLRLRGRRRHDVLVVSLTADDPSRTFGRVERRASFLLHRAFVFPGRGAS